MTKNLPQIDYSKKFDKQLKKAPPEIKVAFRKRLALFIENQYHPQLNNHQLIGKFTGYRSINITGDWRAIYEERSSPEDNQIIVFLLLGTHSQLYG